MISHHIYTALALARTQSGMEAARRLRPALGAVNHASGGGVGIARYVRDGDEPIPGNIR